MKVPPFPMLAILSLVAAVVSADNIVLDTNGVTTSPQQDVPQWASNDALQLNLSTSDGQANPLQYTVIPLTQNLGLNESESSRGIIRIDGILVAADISNYNQITDPDDVAYLSCDNPNDSFITPDIMLNTLMNIQPKAIVLYSQSSNWCSIGNTDSSYTNILSMADAAEATQALSYLNNTNTTQYVNVSITGNATGDSGSGSSGGSSSTVAMSILYSITGLITLLFLIIIATGAVRAHRYPERYGPRSALGGRPRQSRAKGLARAVLDTMPIVKFNNNQRPAKPDPELELEAAATEVGTQRTGSNLTEDRIPVVPVAAGGNGIDAVTPMTPVTDSHQTPEAGNSADENSGCSICTEDFTVGEDMRVLPCGHQFHPNCIDPWLINVSGTCPLCRLDLRSEAAGANEAPTTERGSTLPPPLALEAEDGVETSASHRHPVSRFFDIHRLRQATAEEQIEALRQMRSTRPEAEAHEADGEERGQRARLTAKMKDKFRIRTRARSPDRRAN